MVSFAGFEMPIRYDSQIKEHLAVRSTAGIFDVSHMGEIEISGKGAFENLQYLTTNDVARLSPGDAQYTAVLNIDGGFMDDLILYRLDSDRFLACVNAANTQKIFSWFKNNIAGEAKVKDRSAEFGLIALQGPSSVDCLKRLDADLFCDLPGKFRHKQVLFEGASLLLARTGYTGEDGFEIFVPAEATPSIWNALLERGATACGLAARDTLRLEAALPLYGNELGEEITPFEAGLSWIVKLKKGDFIGRKALIDRFGVSPSKFVGRQLVGLKITGDGIARPQAKVCSTDDKEVGFVTSGTKTPSLDYPIALALLKKETKLGELLMVEQRGEKFSAEVVQLPFYKRIFL